MTQDAYSVLKSVPPTITGLDDPSREDILTKERSESGSHLVKLDSEILRYGLSMCAHARPTLNVAELDIRTAHREQCRMFINVLDERVEGVNATGEEADGTPCRLPVLFYGTHPKLATEAHHGIHVLVSTLNLRQTGEEVRIADGRFNHRVVDPGHRKDIG
ncbi:hypothetical protein [Thermophilibacter sp.]